MRRAQPRGRGARPARFTQKKSTRCGALRPRRPLSPSTARPAPELCRRGPFLPHPEAGPSSTASTPAAAPRARGMTTAAGPLRGHHRRRRMPSPRRRRHRCRRHRRRGARRGARRARATRRGARRLARPADARRQRRQGPVARAGAALTSPPRDRTRPRPRPRPRQCLRNPTRTRAPRPPSRSVGGCAGGCAHARAHAGAGAGVGAGCAPRPRSRAGCAGCESPTQGVHRRRRAMRRARKGPRVARHPTATRSACTRAGARRERRCGGGGGGGGGGGRREAGGFRACCCVSAVSRREETADVTPTVLGTVGKMVGEGNAGAGSLC
jgi:hypothetical protein